MQSLHQRVPSARGLVAAAAGVMVAGATIAGFVGAPAALAAKQAGVQRGGVIKFAEQPEAAPNYIFPETTSANQTLFNNSQFINLMYPFLYAPSPDQPTLDWAHSMAYPPVWSDHNTVVTIHLRHYMWSDGVPVTSRDLMFYINLAEAEGPTWGNYAPGEFPYNVKSFSTPNPDTLVMVLDKAFNPTWYDDNQIGEITPIPQHAWDKESANGPVGNYDETPQGAKKVLAFLQKEAADTSTYATNPLWKVVDGPFELKSFGGASSPDVFVPNPHYSGPKPYISEFEEIPFTSSSAEFTSLKAGPSAITYGYVPTEDIPAIPSIKAEGYKITPAPTWGFDYIIPNTKNPQVGAILSQTYIRQVLAHLTDQTTMIQHFMDSYGVPTYGPTPLFPKGNPFVTKEELTNPYPFSIAAAEALLREHGWKVVPGGVDVCEKPGPSGCGAGVAKGQKLELTLLYSSGITIMQEDTDLFVSDAAQAGVKIIPEAKSFNTVVSQVQPCVLPKDKNTPYCSWQLGEYGGISLSTYPSGDELFETGAAFNAGQYSNPTLDRYIKEVFTAPNLQPYYEYENLVIHDEPWIWQPVPDNIFATVSNLAGYGLTSEFDGGFGYIEPQFWYFTK